MQTQIEPTFEQLQIEIQSLSHKKNQLLQLLVSIESYLNADFDAHFFYQSFQKHILALKSLTKDQSEADRLGILIDYFFNQINFKVIDESGYEKLPHWQFDNVIKESASTGFISRLLFIQLAQELNINIYAVQHDQICLIGWKMNHDEQYLNLHLKAKRLSQQEIIFSFNQRSDFNSEKTCLENLDSVDLLKIYLNQMMTFFNKFNSPKKYLKLLNLYLCIDKNNLHCLSERAFLYKEFGQTNKAYNDLKRYMSFTDTNSAPKNIKLTYYELQAIHKERVDLLLRQEPKTFH